MVRDYQPAFVDAEPDSISIHLANSRTPFNNTRPVANMNTSVFGHPVQNSSSCALKELFEFDQPKEITEPTTRRGVDKTKSTTFRQESMCESQRGDNKSDYSHSQKSSDSARLEQRQGGGDPGDSDGKDSDNGGGSNGPCRGPKRLLSPINLKKNPFSAVVEEVSSNPAKPPPEPQFDTKLKLDAIPTWDGNLKNLRRWLLQVHSLVKRSSVIFKQLGTLVPTQLTGSAEVWYYSQSIETHD